jgi:hypothetical protein
MAKPSFVGLMDVGPENGPELPENGWANGPSR